MQPVFLSLWILSYTLSLLTILMGILNYWKQREASLKYYLLHKMNLLAVIVLFMASQLIEIDDFYFQVLLFNILGLMNFILGRMIFSFAEKKPPIVPTLLLPLFIQSALNLLFFFHADTLLYFFFAFMFIPIVISGVMAGRAPERIRVLFFWRELPACAGFMALFSSFGVCAYFILLFSRGIRSAVFYHYYFSLFYMLVNIISLSHFVYRFRRQTDMGERELVRMAEEKLFARYDLTARELEITDCLVRGLTYQASADKCFISLSTVKKHANSVYRKTGTKNGRQLSRLYNELKHSG